MAFNPIALFSIKWYNIGMEKIVEYAPIIIVVIMVLIQMKFFVTPQQMEIKHREILNDVDDKYAAKVSVARLESQFHEMSEKIDKIYDILIAKN